LIALSSINFKTGSLKRNQHDVGTVLRAGACFWEDLEDNNFITSMEENRTEFEYLHELPKPNPIQKKSLVPPRSICPQLPLPNFKYSEDEVDLANGFVAADQKEQHVLRETTLSKLFEDPVYKSNLRLDPRASNLKFGCSRAFYS
jgi:hypothetical protein